MGLYGSLQIGNYAANAALSTSAYGSNIAAGISAFGQVSGIIGKAAAISTSISGLSVSGLVFGKPVARKGDIVVGACVHGPCMGIHLGSTNNMLADYLGVIRQGDFVMLSCPICKMGIALQGSTNLISQFLGVHRVGDFVVYPMGGCGTTITGSQSLTAGG